MMLDDKILNIKERNEWQAEKVAKNKALLEAQKEKNRKELYEKEQIEMGPLNGDTTMPLRTFNASAIHDTAGFRKTMNSSQVKNEASPSKKDIID